MFTNKTTYSSIPFEVEDFEADFKCKQHEATSTHPSIISTLVVSLLATVGGFMCIFLAGKFSSPNVVYIPYIFLPYSSKSPQQLGSLLINRTYYAAPGTGGAPQPVFGLYNAIKMPLPTNSWAENMFVGTTNSSVNNIFQIPYVIDTAGSLTGAQVHAVFMTASSTAVITNYIATHGVTLSGLEIYPQEYRLVPPRYSEDASPESMPSGQAVSFVWQGKARDGKSTFFAHFTRGSPYLTTEYRQVIYTSPELF
jgi:hypothetical protein